METVQKRMRVTHTPSGQSGTITDVFNLGKLGDLRSDTGARFIVFAEECREEGEPAGDFEELERMLPSGQYWLRP